MRNEVIGMINNTMSANKAHEALADIQVIISGVPKTDNDGIAEALKLLEKIDPDITEADIDSINRFPMASDDGTHPMIVTLNERSKAEKLINTAEANEDEFPWFQRSLARYVRRWNARQEREKERLNANVPDTDPMVWDTKVVGQMKILRHVPNPKYVAPAHPETTVAGYPAPKRARRGHGSGSKRRREEYPMDFAENSQR